MQPKPRPRKARPKGYFLGVSHSTWNLFGRTENLKHLNHQLHVLKDAGIHEVGIELLPEKKPEGDRKKTSNFRYFYGAKLLLQRKGIVAHEVDDPTAVHLHQWIRLWEERDPKDIPSGHETLHQLQRYFKEPLDYREFVQLQAAISYLRTRIMILNARKKGLKAIIAGVKHADEANENEFEIIYVDRPFLSDTFASLRKKNHDQVDEARKCYEKYGRTLLRILRDSKKGKIKLEPIPDPSTLPSAYALRIGHR